MFAKLFLLLTLLVPLGQPTKCPSAPGKSLIVYVCK